MNEAFLRSVLGAMPTEPRWDGRGEGGFLDLAAAHDVEPLLRYLGKEQGWWEHAPASVRTALDERARTEAGIEALRAREIQRVVGGLRDAGVDVLVFKGGALAYTHYARPYLRPRRDTDVLVRRSDVERASAVLRDLGYDRRNSINRDGVHNQKTFRQQAGAVPQDVDLHWCISNRPLFASMVSFDDLWRDAVGVDALGEGARTPAPPAALLLACLHRVAHHDSSDRLIWLYDIKLLAARLSPAEWCELRRLAEQARAVTLCWTTLQTTADTIGCRLPHAFAPDRRHLDEPSAEYLDGTGTGLRSLVLDLSSARGAGAKWRLLVGHVFPDPAYMRTAFGAEGNGALAAAYVRRGVRASARLLGLPVARTPEAERQS